MAYQGYGGNAAATLAGQPVANPGVTTSSAAQALATGQGVTKVSKGFSYTTPTAVSNATSALATARGLTTFRTGIAYTTKAFALTNGINQAALTFALRGQTYAQTLQKLGLTQQGLAQQRQTLQTQIKNAQFEQALEQQQFATKMQEYTANTPNSLFAQQQRAYLRERTQLSQGEAARGATGTIGAGRAAATLTASNQSQIAQLYRQERLAQLGQQAEIAQYGTQMRSLATKTKQLGLAGQRETITKAAITDQYNYARSLFAPQISADQMAALQAGANVGQTLETTALIGNLSNQTAALLNLYLSRIVGG